MSELQEKISEALKSRPGGVMQKALEDMVDASGPVISRSLLGLKRHDLVTDHKVGNAKKWEWLG